MSNSHLDLIEDIVDTIVRVVHEEGEYRAYKLAIEWPALAAELAELLDAKGGPIPPPFRRARQAVQLRGH